MSLKLRIEGDARALTDFLEATKYPQRQNHPAELLQRYAIMLRIETPAGGVVGFLWAGWFPECPDDLDVHAAIAPEHRGRWLTADLLDDLFKVALLLGARSVSTRSLDKRIGNFLVRRFGFERLPDGRSRKQIED